MTTSLYYRDPDRNFVELQVDNFASADEVTTYMSGDEHDNDSVGPAIDVTRMITARRQGASVAGLTTRAWALAGSQLPDPMLVVIGA